ncbi:acetyltransferase [Mizugakiibacter sediminis]|uniref:Acetyltransferase n=1 Tax=Mizugakiibacter sediminis TaxID=1475481 RepID=A0A0K8QNH9_9GAMM|nr:GNAT family N-acetyltransferase [Mizugakiibacter sediminis]GAP66444.1 acetyltransferase [Mizugakiibacter sediminis]
MTIRPLDTADAAAYQRLRLLALRESPTAFSASYEEEVGRPLDDVAARIAPAKDGSICMLGVFVRDELAGFVAIVRPQRAKLRHAVELAGMYVAPAHRRRGLGRALLDAAIAMRLLARHVCLQGASGFAAPDPAHGAHRSGEALQPFF